LEYVLDVVLASYDEEQASYDVVPAQNDATVSCGLDLFLLLREQEKQSLLSKQQQLLIYLNDAF